MKKLLHILTIGVFAAVLAILPAVSGTFARAAATVQTTVKLSGCDVDEDKFLPNIGTVDAKNYIDGGASLSAKSIMPSLYVELGGADTSAIAFDQAYLEFYYFIDDASHSDYYAAFVLSAKNQKMSDTMAEKNGSDCFVWELSEFRDKLHDGWNYICLRLFDAKYTQGALTKEQAYGCLRYLTVADIAATKPGFETMGWEDKISKGGMYILTIAFDEISIVDRPLDYGGADGDISFTTIQRMDGIENRNGDAYISGVDGKDLRGAAYIVFYVLVGVAVATEVALVTVKTVRRKKV